MTSNVKKWGQTTKIPCLLIRIKIFGLNEKECLGSENLKSLSHNLDKQDLEEKLKTLRTDKCWSCQYEIIYM